eukprot:jgi/Tetstr1/450832/TSEL_037868.t1
MMGSGDFSDEFKRNAVAQITELGYPVAEVSKRLGVSPHSLYAWKKKFSKPAGSSDADQAAEIRRLKKELARVTEERDILKKATAYFAKDANGFYAWLKNPLSKRALEDARQTELISNAWKESGRVYGYRKLHDDLLDQGETSCANRIVRLAKLAGIKGQIGYKRRPGSYGGRPSIVVDSTLARQFDVKAPDRAWVTDITYIRTQEGFSYLVVVIDLFSRRVIDQVAYIATSILEAREAGTPLKEQAVLFRTSSHSGPLEIELTRRNIPFVKFGGLKFLDAAHIKDMLAVLRWVENPRDRVAGFRVLQLMPGVGPGTAGRVLDALDTSSDPVWALSEVPMPSKAGQHWTDLVTLFGRLSGKEIAWPLELSYVRQWYEPLLEAGYEDAHIRTADIIQLEQIASGYPSRDRFLTELTLDPPDATSDQPGVPLRDEDYLILSTIHSAKGQEWKSVHVLNVVDGCMPSDLGAGTTEELEEERRLLYVAMTRAKDELHLLVPQKFYVTQQSRHGDRHLYAQRTRFIPRSLTHLFDDVLWPPVTPVRADLVPSQPTRVDVAAKMRSMW